MMSLVQNTKLPRYTPENFFKKIFYEAHRGFCFKNWKFQHEFDPQVFEYFLRYRLSVRFLTDALVEGGPCVQFILDARDRMPPRVRAYTFQCCHFFHDTEKNIDMISVILPLEKICKKIDPIGSRDFWPNLHGFDEQCDCLN